MRRLFVLACFVLALLTFASAARASDYIVVRTETMRLFADPYVVDAIRVAQQEWAALGRGPSCNPETATSIDVPVAAAITPPSSCRIMFGPDWLANRLAWINSTDRFARRAGLRDLCHVVVHEVGHLLGFADGDPAPLSGVMTGMWGYLWLPSCTAWVDVLAPEPLSAAAPPAVIRPAKGLWRAVLRPCRTRRCLRRSKVRLARLLKSERLRSLHSSHRTWR